MTRRVEPLGVLYGMRHYLAAVADGSSEPALWALLDIEAVRHEASVITKPPGFDLAVFAARSFGVHQEEPFDVVWRFSLAVAEDARSYQFHPSQTSEEQAEGAVVVRFTAGGAEEQDFKLRVGDKPKRAATLEAAGEILLLDEDDGRVGLKIGPKAPPFEEAFSIIPSGPIDTSTLRDAVYLRRLGDRRRWPIFSHHLDFETRTSPDCGTPTRRRDRF